MRSAALILICILTLSVPGCFAQSSSDDGIEIESVLRLVPLASDMLLDFAGVEARHDFLDRGIAAGVGLGSVCIAVEGLKSLVEEKRPDGSDYRSFPSGHSAVAFLGADLVRQEYGWGYGTAAYVLAAGVGALRLYHEKHWYWDVFAGAALGVAGAQLGTALTPACRGVLDKLFGSSSSVAVAPVYDPLSRTVCGAVAITF